MKVGIVGPGKLGTPVALAMALKGHDVMGYDSIRTACSRSGSRISRPVPTGTLMKICHKIEGCDVDGVTGALALGTQRLLSPDYLSGRMGDGGGCHPRDNIALSWLARELDLSYDWFESVMTARELQTDWLGG